MNTNKKKNAVVRPTDEIRKNSNELPAGLYPDTELCVDLKLLTRQPGRMPVDGLLDGVLMHDEERHFTFIQNRADRGRMVPDRRNPHVFRGEYVNVIQLPDGSLYPTFNRPRYSELFGFSDFCLLAARELIEVSSLGER